MKKLLLIGLGFILFIVGCHNFSTDPQEVDDIKTEALYFSLQVIGSIIDQDIVTFKTFFLDSIYTLDGDGQFPILESNIEEIFNTTLYHSGIDSNTTMNDYYSNYTSTTSTYDEAKEYFIKKHDYELPQFDWITSNDYFYIAEITGSKIIWDDWNIFLVSKINNKWWLKAASG